RVEYSPESITGFIESCIRAKGVPMFRTRYARVPFRVDTKRAVAGICYGGVEPAEPPSRVFVDVPEEDLRIMRERVGDWIFLLRKFKPERAKELEELMGE
ncbi:MAG: hypothetical protein ACUVTD_08160, partial [Nitrososphaerales archaeon]